MKASPSVQVIEQLEKGEEGSGVERDVNGGGWTFES